MVVAHIGSDQVPASTTSVGHYIYIYIVRALHVFVHDMTTMIELFMWSLYVFPHAPKTYFEHYSA